jgi:hypothetical protein
VPNEKGLWYSSAAELLAVPQAGYAMQLAQAVGCFRGAGRDIR